MRDDGHLIEVGQSSGDFNSNELPAAGSGPRAAGETAMSSAKVTGAKQSKYEHHVFNSRPSISL